MTSENRNDNQLNRIETAENQQHQEEEEKWKWKWSFCLWWYKITLWLLSEKRSKVFVGMESLSSHHVALAVGYVWDCGGADLLFKRKGLVVLKWNEVTLTKRGRKPLSIELKKLTPSAVVCSELKKKLHYNRISKYPSDYVTFLLEIDGSTVESVSCVFKIGQAPEAANLFCTTAVPEVDRRESRHSIGNQTRQNSHELNNSTNGDQMDFANEMQSDLNSASTSADTDAENTTNSTVVDNSENIHCNEASQYLTSASAYPMSKCVSRETLMMLSERLGNSAKDVGRQLGLTEAELENIQQNHPIEFTYRVLDKWKQKNGQSATSESLLIALHRARRLDLRDKVFAYIMNLEYSQSP